MPIKQAENTIDKLWIFFFDVSFEISTVDRNVCLPSYKTEPESTLLVVQINEGNIL